MQRSTLAAGCALLFAAWAATPAQAQPSSANGYRADLPGPLAAASLAGCIYRQAGLTAALGTSALGPLRDGQALSLSCDASGNLMVSGGSGGGASGGNTTATVGVIPVFTAQTTGTTSPTAGLFTQALAAPAAGATRKGCTLQNASAGTQYIFFGATQPTALGQGLAIAAGTPIDCSHGGLVVAQDTLWIASASASTPYVLLAQ